MGIFRKMLKHGEAKLSAALNKNDNAAPPKSDKPPTRWEKAIVALHGIVAQVSQIDPDGVDVFCFPGTKGNEGSDVYRNIKDMKGLEALVNSKAEPSGACHMGQAMETVLQEALDRGFDKRPCCILVLTAGRPDDHEALSKTLADTATKVTKAGDLSVTFVHIGDDEWAEQYLKHLDDDLTTTSANGEVIDIVDTIKDEDIQKAVGEIKKEGALGKGGGGALIGAFAGAAMGAGGMYLFNKINAKKRTEGWNGTWRVTFDGNEVSVVSVKDDLDGNLTITGWPDEATSTGQYAENDEGGFNIQQMQSNEPEPIYGTIEDEHTISWSDGTRWDEVPPEGVHWTKYAGAAAAGAAASGAAGYLMQKKFFNKASNKEPCDYVIVLDRSQMMAVTDAGK